MVFAVFMALATVVAFFEMFFTGQSPEEAFAMVEWS